MAFESLRDNLHKIIDRLEDYGVSTVEYHKLRLFKSVMKGAVSLVNLLVYGSLSLFVMLFLSIGGALWLNTFFDDQYTGFLLIGGFYGFLLICMFIFGRKIIERKLLISASALLYDEDDPEPSFLADKEMAEYGEELRKEALRKQNIKT